MKPENLDDVLGELGTFITEELATTQIAIGCLRVVAHRALAEFEAAQDQQETRLLGTDVPGSGWVPSFHGIAGARGFAAEVAEGGRTHRRLTQQWIVTVYTGWESEFRRRIAAAREVDEEAISAVGRRRHQRSRVLAWADRAVVGRPRTSPRRSGR